MKNKKRFFVTWVYIPICAVYKSKKNRVKINEIRHRHKKRKNMFDGTSFKLTEPGILISNK